MPPQDDGGWRGHGMALFELVLVLLLLGTVLTRVAQRIGAPYPALLAVAGAVMAFLPAGTPAALDPDLALALFVAPTLLDAAYDASPRDLRAAWLPVGSLAVVAVLLTVAGVAVVARLLVPGMPWSVAVVLGAIVAPPDASAATAVLRAVNPPRRVMTILEGESLLNDATALLVYRVALGAAAGTAFSPLSAGGTLLLTCAGGALLGWGLGRLYVAFLRPGGDIAVSVVTQFVGTFAIWIAAERLGVSPVLTTVFYAGTLARHVPGRAGGEHRRASYAVWEVAVYVLNALAFILVGLQLRQVVARSAGHMAATAGFALAVLATVVLVRIAWVLGFTTFLRRTQRGPHAMHPPLNGSLAVSWCGMRGIVTLATALALPADGAFPFRDDLVAAAVAVVLGTLVGQGLTLSPLLRLLRLEDDGTAARELALARAAMTGAVATALDRAEPAWAATLRAEFAADDAPPARHDLALSVIDTQRRHLLALRAQGTIGDDTFHQIEEELDWAEGHASHRRRALG